MSPLLVQSPRATENIKGYYLNSRKVRFLRRRGVAAPPPGPRSALPRAIASLRRLSWRRGVADAGESIPVPMLFRIIDVKNILEALINVGTRKDTRERERGTARGAAPPQQSHAKLLLDFNWKTIILVE